MGVSVLRSRVFASGIVIGLLFGLLSVFWPSEMPLVGQASAQVPDSGAQRNRIVKELADLNAKMDELIALLKSGQIKVVCVQADNQKAGVIAHDALQPQVRDEVSTTPTDCKGRNSR